MPHGATYGWERGFVIDYGQMKSEDDALYPSGRNKKSNQKKSQSASEVKKEKAPDWVPRALREAHRPFVDKRQKGGALWVVGGRELKPLMTELKSKGATFYFLESGGKATDHKPAWYLKGYPFPRQKWAKKSESDADSKGQVSKPNAQPRKKQYASVADKVSKKCSNCANLGGSKCTHGGFALCSDWVESKKNPDYWPEMRKGASGWGSSEPVASDFVPQYDIELKKSGTSKNAKKAKTTATAKAKTSTKAKKKVHYPVSESAAKAMTQQLRVGAKVAHKKAGVGTVKSIDGKNAVIHFSKPYKGRWDVTFPIPTAFEQGAIKPR